MPLRHIGYRYLHGFKVCRIIEKMKLCRECEKAYKIIINMELSFDE